MLYELFYSISLSLQHWLHTAKSIIKQVKGDLSFCYEFTDFEYVFDVVY